MSNGLDPDQAQQKVRPGLGQNSLKKLSADNTSRLMKILLTVDYFLN